MASLELRSDRFRIVFRIGGKKLYASLKTTDRKEAEGCMARLEENLRLVERGRLIPPPDADIPTFLLSDGKVAERFHLPEQEQALRRQHRGAGPTPTLRGDRADCRRTG